LSLYDRSKAEVSDLHRSLLEWCRGQVTDSTSAWERIKQSWADGFRLADSAGLSEGSKELLALQVRFNESVDDPLKAVWVEGFTGYEVGPDLFQAFYEEWSFKASGDERGRAWSVLLRSAGEGPHGLEWVHAHRCPLEDSASPSFRPLEASVDAPEVSEDDAGTDDVPWALAHGDNDEDDAGDPGDADDEGEPDDVPWAKSKVAPLAEAEPAAPVEEVPPLTEIRAFFGDAEAQAALGGEPAPVFDQSDAECWLRELRKGGAEAVLRAGLVVLGHLLERWDEWFTEEKGPREIYEGLTRYLEEGDAEGLATAKAKAEAAAETGEVAKEFVPDPLPEGFRAYVHVTNAAEAASRLAEAAGGSAIGLAVKLSPVLSALSPEARLALRSEVLAAFAD
jgi:hypothetical protein